MRSFNLERFPQIDFVHQSSVDWLYVYLIVRLQLKTNCDQGREGGTEERGREGPLRQGRVNEHESEIGP